MKPIVIAALLVLVLVRCGDSASPQIAEIEKKNQELTRRVENLERELLDVQKQLIAQQQALQVIRSQQRDMENYFNKLQAGGTR